MTLFKPRVGKVIFDQTTGGLSVIIPEGSIAGFEECRVIVTRWGAILERDSEEGIVFAYFNSVPVVIYRLSSSIA